MDIYKIINEEVNKQYPAKYVANHVYNLLSDEQKQENDWSFDDYHKTIRNFGENYVLISLDPKELKYNEDFDVDTLEDYKYSIEAGETIPPIVVDSNKEIIDGNHRAKASMDLGKKINAFIPVK